MSEPSTPPGSDASRTHEASDGPRANHTLLGALALAGAAEARRTLERFVRAEAAAFLGFGSAPSASEEIGPRERFVDLGFDSLRAVDFKTRLETQLVCSLRPTLLFDHPTPAALAEHLASEVFGHAPLATTDDATAVPEPEPVAPSEYEGRSAEELRALLARSETKLRRLEQQRSEPIAIVGLGCRLPGASGPDEYWELLKNGVDSTSEVPAGRWPLDEIYDPDRTKPGKIYAKRGGFLKDIEHFDPAFFGISPREALELDPQQRLLLEVAWETLEHAGIAPESLAGSRTGVYVGVRESEYFTGHSDRTLHDIGAYYGTGNALSTASGRLSFVLGLAGSALSIDTACSSSLNALHVAVQAMRRGECTAALVGGVNVLLDPVSTAALGRAGMLSPEGRCKTFDASGDGYARAEGCAMVLLEPLSRARAAGHRVLALVRGTASNQDGASGGLTAPSGRAQEAVVRAALSDAGIAPYQVGYVEAHGTGTVLGDPIEVNALDAVYGQDRFHGLPLYVGSVKTNFGHLETAAGVASLMKLVLALQHELIPRHLHLRNPNPHIDWTKSVVRVTTEPVEWRRGGAERISGVSSFGFSGTNAHAIVSEAPAPQPSGAGAPSERSAEARDELLPLSAASENSLRALVSRYRDLLARASPPALGDLCFTAGAGRAHHQHRLAIRAGSLAELGAKLEKISAGEPDGVATAGRAGAGAPEIAFLFTGQGAQQPGMGRELYARAPVFRAALDRCAAAFARSLEHPLFDVLWGERQELLARTDYTQPALFAIEFALAELWSSLGVQPTWVLGHSVGEYVAACRAGVLDLEDGLRLIAARGRLMVERTQPGAMAAVFAEPARVEPLVARASDRVSIAALNGPANTVISGDPAAVAAICAELAAVGVKSQALTVSHGFHSPLLDPMLAEFAEVARGVRLRAPSVRLVSNLIGGPVGEEIASPDYWVRHVREPVRFADGVRALDQEGAKLLVEIGPAPVLLGMARRQMSGDGRAFVASLRSGTQNKGEWPSFLDAVAELYVRGVPIRWEALHAGEPRARVSLPTYPFDRRRIWLERRGASGATASAATGLVGRPARHPLLGADADLAVLGPGEHLFQKLARASAPSFLGDHRVFDAVVVPGAGLAELCLGAAAEIHPDRPIQLENAVFRRPLVLGEHGATVQVALAPAASAAAGSAAGANWSDVRIFSKPAAAAGAGESDESAGDDEADAGFALHATARVAALAPAAAPAPADLDALRRACPRQLSTDDLYRRLRDLGIQLGPSFQGVVELGRGEGESLGRIRLPDAAGSAENWLLHPALLDACFQSSGAAIGESGMEHTYLPVGIDRIELHRPAGAEVWCHARIRAADAGTPAGPAGNGAAGPAALAADLEIFAPDGALVARISGLRVLRASPETLLKRGDASGALLHEIVWQTHARHVAEGDAGATGTWILVAEHGASAGASAARIAAELGERGGDVAWIDAAALARGERDALDRALERAGEGCRAVVHAVELDDPSSGGQVRDVGGPGSPGSRERLRLASALVAVQALAARRAVSAKSLPRLWLLARGATPAAGRLEPLDATASALWGFGATVRLEHPELGLVRLDLDPRGDADEAARAVDELVAPDAEDQLAFRGGERRAPRLVRAGKRSKRARLSVPEAAAWRLVGSAEGTLDGLRLVPIERRSPGPGEVEVELEVGALNFKDALRALGVLKDVLREKGREREAAAGAHELLGLEGVGRVVAIGPASAGPGALGAGVDGVQVGERVLVTASSCFSSHLTVGAHQVARAPRGLSPVEAAGLQMAYFTAFHALRRVAALRKGETVLIHAAAGGVGQAAIRVARAIGATVYATASRPKWELVRRAGAERVFDSRRAGFARALLDATGGRGADVVLHSLPAEMADESLTCLARGGRIVELGKVGALTAERVATSRPDARFATFDLEALIAADAGLLAELQAELARGFDAGELTPLPTETYELLDAPAAFAALAQGESAGKVVLAFPRPAHADRPARADGPAQAYGTSTLVRADRTYVVTGGLGALGLVFANALVHRGARSLALLGRSAPGEAARAAIAALEAKGARVRVASVDVADGAALDATLREIRAAHPDAPIGGVIHSAGVLGDAVIANLDWPRTARVLAPKTDGARNLDLLTRGDPIDFFVLFSSMAAVLGSAGQAAYSAANAALDGLAFRRRAQGLPALSVDWGPFADAGMAANVEDKNRARFAEMGLGTIKPEQGPEILDRLLAEGRVQTGVLPVRWSKFLASLGAARPRFFDELAADAARATGAAAPAGPSIRDELARAPAPERRERLARYLRAEVAKVLGYAGADDVPVDKKFVDMGFDSLLAVEFRNRLESKLACALAPTALFDHPTVDALVAHLARELLGSSESAAEEREAPASADALLARVEALSEDEAQRELATRGVHG